MQFTREEVARHRFEYDCWMVVKGKAYDVTSVLLAHPGGIECLMDCAGVDATVAFDDVGHSAYAWETLKTCYKGEVSDAQTDVYVKRHKQGSQIDIASLLYPILSITGLVL